MSDPRALRLAYLGNDAWSVPPLEVLASSRHDVALVVTRTPRPGRRGGSAVPTPVADAATRLDLPLAEVETVRAGRGFDALSAARPDVLVVVAYGEILPPSVLAVPSIGAVNLHFSLLPALRGASPVQTALLLGLSETGVSTIAMDEGLDTGDVLVQVREAIAPDDDAGSLGERLARIGGAALVETLDALASGTATRTPQDGGLATYAAKIAAEDRILDWTAPASSVVNRVRALAPEPGATTTFRDAPLKVFRAQPVDAAGRPGEIIGVDLDGFTVGAAEGGVRVLDVGPAGRSRMPARAFVNGFRPVVGERLG
ncbi:MAG: methionyl-tRNA formyltransferase [Actinomycetota bacterium]